MAHNWAHVWARIVMGLIFVLVTVSSPVHAHAMPAKAHMTVPAMDGMDEACARAMHHLDARAKPHAPADHAGCSVDGCNCPLSHCPATPSLLAAEITLPPHAGSTVLADGDSQGSASVHTDTLIRPPRA